MNQAKKCQPYANTLHQLSAETLLTQHDSSDQQEWVLASKRQLDWVGGPTALRTGNQSFWSALSTGLWGLGLLAFLLAGCSSGTLEETTVDNPSNAAVGSISLKIQYGDPDRPDRQLKYKSLRERMTVADVMRDLAENPAKSDSPKLTLETKGANDLAFLESIDGVKNEGAAGRNWMYDVNGKQADRGFGAFELKNGDSVTWRFKTYQEE